MTTPKPLRLAVLGDIAHVNVQRWCQGLAQAGADVHVLSLAAAEAPYWRLHRLSGWGRGKLRYFTAVPAARRVIATIQPDVVAAYYITGYGTLGAWLGFQPLVQMAVGSDVLLAPRHPLLRILVRYNLSRAQLVTAWAPHMAEAARQLGVPAERLFVLPRGIPAAEFMAWRCPEPQADGQPLRLICTRSFTPLYQHEMLVRAVADLQRRGMPVRLTLAGRGPLLPQVQALAQQLDVADQVFFAGFVPNDQLPGQLAQQQVYISLAASDGVSASLLEAMAVGLLPIVPAHPANRYWIDLGGQGCLIETLTPEAVADAIEQSGRDLTLRWRAWQENPAVVSAQADAALNARRYVERFKQLVAAQLPGKRVS